MNRINLIKTFAITLLLTFLFVSCKQEPDVKKELWAVVINFLSPDTAYYPVTKKFPFPDSLRFASLDSIFTNQHKLPVINDSNIIFYDNYRENGQSVCCRQDTLEVYIDRIKDKKYLFAIGDYIAVFQSNNNLDTNLRTRDTPVSLPLWGIKLNTPYPPGNFKNEYEKLGAKYVKLSERFDEVSKQKWNENDSVSVETIQFKNSADRIITAVSKDIHENEMNAMIDSIKNKFPYLIFKEGMQAGSDGKPLKIIRVNSKGVSITFTQISTDEYTFMMTDYYETLKLILNNADTGYIFRDDLRIY